MENRNVKELRQIAKDRKIKYYYNMRKDELILALLDQVHSLQAQTPVQEVQVHPVREQAPVQEVRVQAPSYLFLTLSSVSEAARTATSTAVRTAASTAVSAANWFASSLVNKIKNAYNTSTSWFASSLGIDFKMRQTTQMITEGH